MSFKIVQTIENNKVCITAVPDAWECDGTLYWPNGTVSIDKYRSDKESVPLINWQKLNCVVKMSGLTNFQDAVAIEKQLASLADAEAEKLNVTRENSAPLHHPGRSCDMITDKNDSFTYTANDKRTECGSVRDDDFGTPTIKMEERPDSTLMNALQMTDSREQLLSIEMRLGQLERESANMNAKVDTTLKLLHRILEAVTKESLSEDETETEQIPICFPITSVEQMNMFCEALGDSIYKKKMVKKFSSMFGSNGNQNGKRVAYRLVDKLFDRHLLTKYTWTGSSKGKPKESFVLLREVNKFFNEIVAKADNRFTEMDHENFFKMAILKHSETRCFRRGKPRLLAPSASEYGSISNDGSVNEIMN